MTSVRNRKHLKGFELREYMNHQVLSLVSGFFFVLVGREFTQNCGVIPFGCRRCMKVDMKNACSINQTHLITHKNVYPPLPKNDT